MNVREHVETKWQTTRALGKASELGKSSGDSGEPKAARHLVARPLCRGNFEELPVCRGKGGVRFFLSSAKKKEGPLD